jgi:hypothetical protein
MARFDAIVRADALARMDEPHSTRVMLGGGAVFTHIVFTPARRPNSPL